MSGTLYVVATPIGNLEDITLRALRVLKEVDYILCEDKRVTIKLLNKYDIQTKLISFHKYNEYKSNEYVLSLLNSGKNIAIVSDAGTPLISDPGSKLILSLSGQNVKVVSVPGASALTSSLSLCPYKVDEFLFLGFLPESKNERKKTIESLDKRAKAVVIFVAPHDLNKYLEEIHNVYPKLNVFYSRELTKIYEECWSGEINDLLDQIKHKKIKGEIVLCLSFDLLNKNNHNETKSKKELISMLKKYLSSGYSLKQASKTIAKELNMSSKNLYDMYIKNKG